MAGPLEAVETADQQLAAPDRPVGAVPGAVIDRADGRATLPVLGQARRQVGVVMLDPDGLEVLALERIFGREVLRMQIVSHEFGAHSEEAGEVLDALGEALKRLVILQVADVMRHPRSRALRHAEGVLQLRAAGEDGACCLQRNRDARRGVAA